VSKRGMLFIAAVVSFVFSGAMQADVRICTSGGYDVWADNTGVYPASYALQTCVNDPAVAVINLQPGTYLIDAPVVVTRPLTIRTAGLAFDTRNCQQMPGSCATLLASSSNYHCINNPGYCYGTPSTFEGMLQAKNTNRVIFDHLVLDGNRANRQATTAKSLCQTTSNRYGFNSRMAACGGASSAERCEFTYNFTKNALCGTGLEFAGDYARIQGNAAYNNGVEAAGLTADGLTIARNNNGIINDNHLVNNTGVALAVGAGRNSQIQSNWIQQNGVYAYAALMLHNVNNQTGDFTNATIRYNTINCYGLNCGIGLELGSDPFTSVDRPNITGGLVTQNNINSARVLINFGGTGVPINRTTVTNNTLTNPPTYWIPLAPGSPCYAAPNVLQNLPNNNTSGVCGNFANADGIPTSSICFQACF
jgi:hypothetical protein